MCVWCFSSSECYIKLKCSLYFIMAPLDSFDLILRNLRGSPAVQDSCSWRIVSVANRFKMTLKSQVFSVLYTWKCLQVECLSLWYRPGLHKDWECLKQLTISAIIPFLKRKISVCMSQRTWTGMRWFFYISEFRVGCVVGLTNLLFQESLPGVFTQSRAKNASYCILIHNSPLNTHWFSAVCGLRQDTPPNHAHITCPSHAYMWQD